jgi:hypothetical protein
MGKWVRVEKPEEKEPLGRPWRRWDDIKQDLEKQDEEAWVGLTWLMTETSNGLL